MALFIILGIIGWFIFGILGYIIYQKFGNEYVRGEYGLFFAMGAVAFCFSILLVIYERIKDFITDRF